jgi:catechol 2,3-dioxygenase-like lactoylglutathione lyase family enzyme
MSQTTIRFDHIHLLSRDAQATAEWYVEMLGGTISQSYALRGAPQICVELDGAALLIRGQRPGEQPAAPAPLQSFADYASHDCWGTDHFGFTVTGDFTAFCEGLRRKGATFSVEPHEFQPGSPIAYLAAPDGVTVELVAAKA